MKVNNSLEGIISKGCQSDFDTEREFRERVVSRLLETLGWTSSGDTHYEVEISAGTVKLRVDYVIDANVSKFALEVKKPDVNISEGSDSWVQIQSYLKLSEELDYGVLYNGRQLYIFRNGMVDPVIEWHCSKNIEAFQYLNKMSFPMRLNALTGLSTPKILKFSNKIDKLKVRLLWLKYGLLVDFIVIMVISVVSGSRINGIFIGGIILGFALWIMLTVYLITWIKYKMTNKTRNI